MLSLPACNPVIGFLGHLALLLSNSYQGGEKQSRRLRVVIGHGGACTGLPTASCLEGCLAGSEEPEIRGLWPWGQEPGPLGVGIKEPRPLGVGISVGSLCRCLADPSHFQAGMPKE